MLIQLFEKIGIWETIDKIAHETSLRYSISKGQAKAVIRKVLDEKLDSGSRSFLHDLRNKIRKYRELVEHFERYVIIPTEGPSLNEQELRDAYVKLKAVPVEERETGTMIKMKEFYNHRNQIMGNINKLEAVPKLEKPIYGLSPMFFVCAKCDYKEELGIDFIDSDEVNEIPIHCGIQMSIYIPHKAK